MNIQTIEVGSHWVLDGGVRRYTDDQKRKLEKAWSEIEELNENGVLRNLSYSHIIEPVVRNALTMHGCADEEDIGNSWDNAHYSFSTCVHYGKSPTWSWVGCQTKYIVGSLLCDTKEKAVAARVQCGDVTPELLIELAEWLKEKQDD